MRGRRNERDQSNDDKEKENDESCKFDSVLAAVSGSVFRDRKSATPLIFSAELFYRERKEPPTTTTPLYRDKRPMSV